MKEAFIGIGSNLGNKLKNCLEAVNRISSFASVKKLSSPYITSPYGDLDQAWFVNCACKVETELSPEELLDACLSVEKDMGRVRVRRWGPRLIDLDILFYGDLIIQTERLFIPHPGIKERLFVLAPLVEIEKDLVHPVYGKTVEELLEEGSFEGQRIRRISWI